LTQLYVGADGELLQRSCMKIVTGIVGAEQIVGAADDC